MTAAPPAIPLPTDTTAPEYDAPPPGERRFLGIPELLRVVQRPASRVVNIPNEKAVIGTMPEYDAPAPAGRAR